MDKVDFLKDYPEAKKWFKLYAKRIQEHSSWVIMRYKKNSGQVEMNKIFTKEEFKEIKFYLLKLWDYSEKANKHGYASIEFGDINTLSGEYQWSTVADYVNMINQGFLPRIKDGTGSVDAYVRALETAKTAQSTNRVILSIFHQINSIAEDKEYHPIFENMGYLFPNKGKDINAGTEWVIGIDPFTKYNVIYKGKDTKANSSIYYPSTPQKKVQLLIDPINTFIKEMKNDTLKILKLAIFLKCRAGKTPAFIELINATNIDYCFFVSRRVAVSYEVGKNVREFFNNAVYNLSFKNYSENPYIIELKTILTMTMQSFEDDDKNVNFDDELSKLREKLLEIAPYVKTLTGCLVVDEAQIGGATEKMKLFVKTVEEILQIRIFMDLSGTPSKLYALKDYDHIAESDLQEENEIRDQQCKEYEIDKNSFAVNYWD